MFCCQFLAINHITQKNNTEDAEFKYSDETTTIISDYTKDNQLYIENYDTTSYRSGELFTDANADGVYNPAEEFTDANSNGVYDFAEEYVDANGNGVYDPAEEFIDANGNGVYDTLALQINGTLASTNQAPVFFKKLWLAKI